MKTSAIATTQPPPLRTWLTLVRREWLIERRSLAWLSAAGFLALQEVVVIGLAFSSEPASRTRTAMIAGALWLAFLFAGIAGSQRSFAQEYQDGALDGVLCQHGTRTPLFFAKVAVTSGLLAIVCLALMLGAAFFLSLELSAALLLLLPVMLAASIGYVAVTTLLAASLGGGQRLSGLSIGTLPLLVPLFLFATMATRDVALLFHERALLAASGGALEPLADALLRGCEVVARPLGLLIALDAVYLGLGSVLFGKALER